MVITDVSKLKSGFIFVKKRTGLLEYKDDPEGKINLLARTFGKQLNFDEGTRRYPGLVVGMACNVSINSKS